MNCFWKQPNGAWQGRKEKTLFKNTIVVLKSVFPFYVEPQTLVATRILLRISSSCFAVRRFARREKENLLSQKAVALLQSIFSSARGYFPLLEDIFLFKRRFCSAIEIFFVVRGCWPPWPSFQVSSNNSGAVLTPASAHTAMVSSSTRLLGQETRGKPGRRCAISAGFMRHPNACERRESTTRRKEYP